MNNCGCGCQKSCNSNPCEQHNCRASITMADLADLVYIAGLDENLCPKFALPDTIAGLTDCAGVPLGQGAAVVTCAAFANQLCARLNLLPAGAVADGTTRLVGADCQTHVLPPIQAPLETLDSECLHLEIVDGVLTGNPIVSGALGNTLSCEATGLFVPSTCTQLAAIAGPVVPATDATVLVSAGSCTLVNLTNYQENLIFANTPCIALVNTAGTVTATPVISPAPGNQLTCGIGGLFVPAAPPAITVTGSDTDAIDVTVTQVGNNYDVSAVLITSDFPGNIVNVFPDGVYVPDVCTQFAAIAGAPALAGPATVFIGRDCLPYTVPQGAIIAVQDTLTVDHSLVAGVLSSNVRIDPLNELIEVLPGGLAVRCANVLACIPQQLIVGQDTPCFNFDVQQIGNSTTISGGPIISPAVGNQLSCAGDGLFVPAGVPQTCAQVSALFADQVTAPTPGVTRLLADDCNAYLAPTYTPVDTQTVDTVIGFAGNNPVFSANVRLANTYPGDLANCNGLVSTVDGLSAPFPYGGSAQFADAPVDVYFAPVAPGQIFVSPQFVLNIANPNPCRRAILWLTVRHPQCEWVGSNPAGGDKFTVTMFRQINFPSLVSATGVGQWTLRTVDDTGDVWPGANVIAPLIIQPGEAGTLGVTLQFQMNIGSLAVLNIQNFILRSWLINI